MRVLRKRLPRVFDAYFALDTCTARFAAVIRGEEVAGPLGA
jgi:hypothetical protein